MSRGAVGDVLAGASADAAQLLLFLLVCRRSAPIRGWWTSGYGVKGPGGYLPRTPMADIVSRRLPAETV
jgi:hypothetical protein